MSGQGWEVLPRVGQVSRPEGWGRWEEVSRLKEQHRGTERQEGLRAGWPRGGHSSGLSVSPLICINLEPQSAILWDKRISAHICTQGLR